MRKIIIVTLLFTPFLVRAQWTTSGTTIYNTNTGNVEELALRHRTGNFT